MQAQDAGVKTNAGLLSGRGLFAELQKFGKLYAFDCSDHTLFSMLTTALSADYKVEISKHQGHTNTYTIQIR